MDSVDRIGCFRSTFWQVFGVFGPLACLGVEAGLHVCRDTLFDPLPTLAHALLVLAVPVAVLLGVPALDRPALRTRALGMLFGSAICTTLMYAVPFVPLLPLSLAFSLGGIGLLGLAPILAPIALLSLAAEYRVRAGRPGWKPLRGTCTGFCASIALLALLDLGTVRTLLAVRRCCADPADAASAAWVRANGRRATLDQLATGWREARPLAFLVYACSDFEAAQLRQAWPQMTGEPFPEPSQRD